MTTRIAWDANLETGNTTVDSQHRRIFELLNTVVVAVEEGRGQAVVASVLEELSEYVCVHFAAEKALMMETGFPAVDVEVHTSEHDDLTRETRERILAWRMGELDAVELVEFLGGWLVHHIGEIDQVLADHVRAWTGERSN